MHSPLSTQEFAHLREVAGPSPLRRMSMTPAITARGSASAIPAAPVIGQASKHLPHCVQASAMVATWAAGGFESARHDGAMIPTKRGNRPYLEFERAAS